MPRWFLAIFYMVLLGGAVNAAQIELDFVKMGLEEPDDPYLTCGSDRILSFGSTHRTQPVAEFAAIVRWRLEAKENGKGFDNWSLAKDRQIKCWKVPRGPFQQCKVSAHPCRPKAA